MEIHIIYAFAWFFVFQIENYNGEDKKIKVSLRFNYSWFSTYFWIPKLNNKSDHNSGPSEEDEEPSLGK